MADKLLSSDALATEVLLIKQDELSRNMTNNGRFKRAGLVREAAQSLFPEELSQVDSLASLARGHIDNEISLSEAASSESKHAPPVRVEPPQELSGNLAVFRVVSALIVNIEGRLPKPRLREAASIAASSATSLIVRSDLNPLETTKINSNILPFLVSAASLFTASDIINDTMRKSAAVMEDFIQDQKGHRVIRPRPLRAHSSDTLKGVSVTSLGNLVVFRVDKLCVVMTKVHYLRVLHMLRGIGNCLVVEREMSLNRPFLEIIKDLFQYFLDNIPSAIDFSGEYTKAARNMLVAKLADDMVDGRSAYQQYLALLDQDKRTHGNNVMTILRHSTRAHEDAVNLANIFRLFPHPDTNLADAFSTIQGLMTPNVVDPVIVPRFLATTRRALYKSLSQQRFQVRLHATSPAGVELETAANATHVQSARLYNASWKEWQHVTLEVVRDIPDPVTLYVPPSDKSSQSTEYESFEAIEDATKWARSYNTESQDLLKSLSTVNDAITQVQGVSRLMGRECIARFERVIRFHQAFESRFLPLPIDQIPAEDLAEFIRTNPDASYLVGTEPKFGEIHKKVTRMFYMAQQELKGVTQRVERLAKLVSRKHKGVSITKSYSQRRQDLENFASAMTGPEENTQAVFVSFDMSEFSKKFPMELVRKYGDVLAEITGHDWLRRIDVIFRSSIVIHNTRGYFAHLEGVKGGFEGFLNFVWSSIHAVIMEISLECTGLAGDILTFSDDGLLQLKVPRRFLGERLHNSLLRIQEIYSRFGLVFHMGKTLASLNVWEYLGDVCHQSRLLPMWLKEVCAMTRITKDKGLDPVYSRIRAIEGQARSLCSAGLPLPAAYLLMRMHCERLVRRLSNQIDQHTIEAAFILPSAAGGLRIPSPPELAVSSTISTDAEVLADLYLTAKHDQILATTIVAYIQAHLRRPKSLIQAVISGTAFSTTAPDTSGMSVLTEAIDEIIMTAPAGVKIKSNPLRGPIKTDLEALILDCRNLFLAPVIDLIFSMPNWVEYTKSISLVKSTSVLRLIPRRRVRELQSKDTKNVTTSLLQLRAWLQVPRAGDTDLINFYLNSARRSLPGIHLAPLKLSPRMFLARPTNLSEAEGGVVLRESFEERKSDSSAVYREPHMMFSSEITSLRWYSEKSGDFTIKAARRMLDSISRFLAYSPESEHLCASLCALSGFMMPIIPAGFNRGAHRHRLKAPVSQDVRITIPRYYQVSTHSYYYGRYAQRLFALERGDRSTLHLYVKVLGSIHYNISHPMGKTGFDEVNLIYYNAHSDYVDIFHSTHPMIVTQVVQINRPLDPPPPELVREFQSSLLEYQYAIDFHARVGDSSVGRGQMDDVDHEILRCVAVNRMAKWMSNMLSGQPVGIVPSSFAPIIQGMRPFIITEAAVAASLDALEPNVRTELGKILNAALTKARANADEHAQDDWRALPNTVRYQLFHANITRVFNFVAGLRDTMLPFNDLATLLVDHDRLQRLIGVVLNRASLLRPGRVYITRPDTFPAGHVPPMQQAVVRRAISNTIDELISAGRQMGWDMQAVAAAYDIQNDVDDILDMLHIIRPLIRTSQHRAPTNPYNTTSARIAMFKFYEFLRYYYSDYAGPWERRNINELLRTWRLRPRLAAELANLIRGHRDRIGPDHQEMINSGLLQEHRTRLWHHINSIDVDQTIGTFSRNGYVVNFIDIINLQGAIHREIIQPSMAAIVEVPRALESYIFNEMSLPSRETMRIEEVNTDEWRIRGEHINYANLNPEQRSQISQLLNAHLYDYCTRAAISGVAPTGDADPLLAMASMGLVDTRGQTISMPTDNSQAFLTLFCIRTRYPSAALSNYVLTQDMNNSSIAVFRERGTDWYYTLGVTTNQARNIDFDRETMVVTNNHHPLSSHIPILSLREQEVATRLSVRRFLSAAEESRLPSLHYVMTMAAMLPGGTFVNDNDIHLQAASEIISRSTRTEDVLMAYCIMLAWLRRQTDDDRIQASFIFLSRILNDHNHIERAAVLADMSIMRMWFNAWKITPSLDINDAEVDRIVGLKPNFFVMPSALVAAIAAIPRSPLEAMTFAGNIDAPATRGRMMAYLYADAPMDQAALPAPIAPQVVPELLRNLVEGGDF